MYTVWAYDFWDENVFFQRVSNHRSLGKAIAVADKLAQQTPGISFRVFYLRDWRVWESSRRGFSEGWGPQGRLDALYIAKY